MKPTVGRIVHYQAFGTPGGEYPSVARAAVVTAVSELEPLSATLLTDEKGYRVGLCILNPTGIFFNPEVRFDADGKPGTWRWPPREPADPRPAVPYFPPSSRPFPE
jgi:hypothetical protein